MTVSLATLSSLLRCAAPRRSSTSASGWCSSTSRVSNSEKTTTKKSQSRRRCQINRCTTPTTQLLTVKSRMKLSRMSQPRTVIRRGRKKNPSPKRISRTKTKFERKKRRKRPSMIAVKKHMMSTTSRKPIKTTPEIPYTIRPKSWFSRSTRGPRPAAYSELSSRRAT